jgi:hypothetical protein
MDLSQQMAARYRKHMVTVFVGAGLAVLSMVLGFTLIEVLFTERPPVWLVFLPALGFFAIPAVGVYSTLTNLRCPACAEGVAWQTARNYSVVGRFAKKTCDHCGQRIFGADGTTPRIF